VVEVVAVAEVVTLLAERYHLYQLRQQPWPRPTTVVWAVLLMLEVE
jgi:hypothetical protein